MGFTKAQVVDSVAETSICTEAPDSKAACAAGDSWAKAKTTDNSVARAGLEASGDSKAPDSKAAYAAGDSWAKAKTTDNSVARAGLEASGYTQAAQDSLSRLSFMRSPDKTVTP